MRHEYNNRQESNNSSSNIENLQDSGFMNSSSPTSQSLQQAPKPLMTCSLSNLFNGSRLVDFESNKYSQQYDNNYNNNNNNEFRGSRTSNKNDREAGEYTSICLKNLNQKVNYNELKRNIEYELRNYSNYTVKIAPNRSSKAGAADRILAFVNFSNHGDAREAKLDLSKRIVCGNSLYVEPMFRSRPASSLKRRSRSRSRSPDEARNAEQKSDCKPPLPPFRYNQQNANNRIANSPSTHKRTSTNNDRDNSPHFTYKTPSPTSSNNRCNQNSAPQYQPDLHSSPLRWRNKDRNRSISPTQSSNQQHFSTDASHPSLSGANCGTNKRVYFDNDERDCTHTLFVDNLDKSVNRETLRKLFEQYGVIEEIDIKKGTSHWFHNQHKGSMNTANKFKAFIKYENMDMACEAKKNINGKLIGSSECIIGYGNGM
jgi:RNA-binding protein 15